MSKFLSFLRNQSGATPAEYALIIVVVGAGLAGAAFAIGGKINDAMSKPDCVASATHACE